MPVWKKLKKVTVDDYQLWLNGLQQKPYLYDSTLQSICWVRNLTEAIGKVEPLVGDDDEDTFVFVATYWKKLSSWEFILNSLSIARAIDFTLNKDNSWQDIIESLKFWVDNLLSHSDTRDLVYSGTDYFYDMIQFFSSNRQLADPEQLSKNVLEYEFPSRKEKASVGKVKQKSRKGDGEAKKRK